MEKWQGLLNFLFYFCGFFALYIPSIHKTTKEHIPNSSDIQKLIPRPTSWGWIFIFSALISIFCSYAKQKIDENEKNNIIKDIDKKDSINNINNIKLKEQNEFLLNSNNNVINTNNNLSNQNTNMLSRIDKYQLTIENKTNKINLLQDEIQNIKDYSFYAKMDMFGLDVIAGANMAIDSPLSIMMKKILTPKDGIAILINDKSALPQLNHVIEKYPKFPFGYYFKSLILKERNNSEWKKYANRAIEIFKITTAIEGHHGDHDEGLKRLRTELK